MLFTPEVYGKQDYLINVDKDDIIACKEMYVENCAAYNEDVEELVRLIKPNYVSPSNEFEEVVLFSEIEGVLKAVRN